MRLRPRHHFTPAKNWMNDPNGLIYHEGLYHLYYQHNPQSNEFGNISWGHATSDNLTHWEHHPVALRCTKAAMIYSGCTVATKAGTICAIYTEHIGDTEKYHEQICLAESLDGGFSFDQVSRKVLLQHDNPDFRDPKVFWHDKSNHWIMCVALPKAYTICFYRSEDLLHWTPTGTFTSSYAHGQCWECPDLFPLIDEKGIERWILSLSGENTDGKTWGMFYFIGTFDGLSFISDQQPYPMDYGSDYYAGITFEGLNERIMLAWSGNWAYAGKLNEPEWSGMMASPRRLTLKNSRIIQTIISPKVPYELKASSSLSSLEVGSSHIQWSDHELKIDRTRSKKRFPPPHTQLTYSVWIERIQIYEDAEIIEIVINDGERVYTVQC